MQTHFNNLVIKILFALSLSLLIGSGFIAYQQVKRLQAANNWVIHTYRVIETTTNVGVHLSYAASRVNYYLISKDPQAIRDLNLGADLALKSLNLTATLVKDNPVQAKKVSYLRLLANEKISGLKNIVKDFKELDRAEALREQQLTYKIMQIIRSMNTEEQTLLKLRTTTSQEEVRSSFRAIVLASALGNSLLILSFFLVNYYLLKHRRSEVEREEAATRLQKIINASNDFIAAIDNQYKLIAFNSAYANFFKRTFGVTLKLGMNFKKTVAGIADKHTLLAPWERALQGEEFTLVNKFQEKGKDHYFEAIYSSIYGLDNQRIGALHIMRDISERKKVEQMKNEFVSIVSHELRTPLTSIRGSLGLILGGAAGELNEKLNSLLTIACNNCERLVALINNMLDIEKIETGKMDFQLGLYDLNALAEEALSTTKAFAEKYQINIRLVKHPTKVPVRVDGDRIIQVLTNLISNAIKFSPTHEEVEVVVSIEGNKNARVAVTDKGPGVPPEFHEQIFKKFSQADSSSIRKYGGSGLGLNISKTIIEQSGGTIDFISKDKLTRFYFELPITTEEPLGLNETLSTHMKKNKIKLLYVEDDRDLSAIIIDMLKPFADIISVGTKRQTLKALGNEKFNVILLDLKLPDGSGVDLLPELKKMDIPVVIFTAYELPENFIRDNIDILIKSKTSNETLINAVLEAAKRQHYSTPTA